MVNCPRGSLQETEKVESHQWFPFAAEEELSCLWDDTLCL